MRTRAANICSLLAALGLVWMGPACGCESSGGEMASLAAVNSAAGTSAHEGHDCCSEEGGEHDSDSSDDECCNCSGHSAEAPAGPAELGVGVVSGADRVGSTAAESAASEHARSPWTLDRTRYPGTDYFLHLASETGPPPTGSAPRYLALQVLRL